VNNPEYGLHLHPGVVADLVEATQWYESRRPGLGEEFRVSVEEVIDLLQQPARARSDQIVAIPTLVRRVPEPVRKVIGTLADTERVLVGLRIGPRRTPPSDG